MPTSRAERLWTFLLILLLAALLLCARQALAQPVHHGLPPEARTALLIFLRALFPELSQHSAPVTYYVSQRAGEGLSAGNDTHSCEQARSTSTPRASINRGLACLAGGDTLVVGPGTYDELLISQQSSSRECHSGDAAVQPGCATIPNGLSPTQRTTLKATGTATIVSPIGRRLPGGGSAITLLDYARHLHLEGLRVVKHSASGSTGGIYMGNAQYVSLTGNELDNGQIKAGTGSRYVEVLGNHVFNTGKDLCPQGVKPTPAECPHGMYLCGTDHTITDNHVHDTSYYGIQVSCEQGGIARIKLERNRVERSPVVGIRCAGSDCLIAANVLVANGTAITVGGSGTVTNNTIHDWFHGADAWGQDPWGIYGSLDNYTVTNNVLTGMKSAYLAISNNTAAPNAAKVHHNMCEVGGNAGCTLLAPASAIYTNSGAGDFTLKTGSPAIGAGAVGATTDITGRPYTTPDVGAYAAGSAPVPPIEPPIEPPLAQALACTGSIQAVPGPIDLVCQPQPGRRR